MALIDDLKAERDRLKGKKIELSADEKDEAKIREEITAEEERLRKERAAKHSLDVARRLDAAKRKAGPEAVCEVVDLLDADGRGPGVFVVRNPPPEVGDAFQTAIREKGRADPIDVANLVIGSMVDPDPNDGDKGVEIRDTFDRFPFAPQSLSNVVLRLGGLKIEEKRKSR